MDSNQQSDMKSLGQLSKDGLRFAAIATGLAVPCVLLQGVAWSGSTQLHTLMEATATLLALMVGILAILRFYSRKSNAYLFIGVGFIGTGLLDGYHALVTSSFFHNIFPSPPPSLIPWSWNSSRMFLSVLMLMSLWAWRREEQQGTRGRISEWHVYGIVTALTMAAFAFFAFVPLPRAYHPESFFGRPQELLPALFFLFALIGYVGKGGWRHDQFENWLVLSLLVGFLSQAVVMSRSFALFDVMFELAHLMKIASYGIVFVGLLFNMYGLFRQADMTALELHYRVEEHAARLSETEAEASRLRLVHELNQSAFAVVSGSSFDEVIQRITDQARKLIGAHQAVTSFTIDRDWSQAINGLSLSEKYDEFKGYAAIPDGSGIYALVCEKNQPMRLTQAELESHPRWKNFGNDPKHPPMRGWLAVPLVGPNRQNLGLVQLSDKVEGEFTEEDEAVLIQLAQTASYSLQWHRAHEELDCRVQLRTAELQRSNTDLTRINKELDDFAYVASHDLKAPLRAIDNLAKWIEEDAGDSLPETCHEHIAKMKSRVRRMEKLLTDLLHYSRAGRKKYQPEVIDMHRMITDIAEFIAPPAGFQIVVAGELPEITSPLPPLQQVVMNLINNAVKHHDKEQGRIEISAADEGDFVRFSIADDGPGIDAKFHERIFGMFQTLAPRDKVEGSGMGLAVIKKLVEGYGGSVSVESELGRGSTFQFTWPHGNVNKENRERVKDLVGV